MRETSMSSAFSRKRAASSCDTMLMKSPSASSERSERSTISDCSATSFSDLPIRLRMPNREKRAPLLAASVRTVTWSPRSTTMSVTGGVTTSRDEIAWMRLRGVPGDVNEDVFRHGAVVAQHRARDGDVVVAGEPLRQRMRQGRQRSEMRRGVRAILAVDLVDELAHQLVEQILLGERAAFALIQIGVGDAAQELETLAGGRLHRQLQQVGGHSARGGRRHGLGHAEKLRCIRTVASASLWRRYRNFLARLS